jgi:hypothetical protein
MYFIVTYDSYTTVRDDGFVYGHFQLMLHFSHPAAISGCVIGLSTSQCVSYVHAASRSYVLGFEWKPGVERKCSRRTYLETR